MLDVERRPSTLNSQPWFPGYPSPHPAEISFVVIAESSSQSRLLVQHYEQMSYEKKHAPKRNRRSDRYHDHPADLRRSGGCGRNNARPRQESTGQINQHEANKKRSVSNCTNQDKHG